MRLAALLEAWRRLSARERILAGLACGALMLVVLRYGVVAPYLAYTAQLEERIERDVQRLAKMQRQRDRAAEVQQRMRLLEKQFAAAYDQLVPGETPTLAAARLQERVQTFADRSGLTLVTTQVMRDKSLGSLRKTRVQMTFRGDTPAVADFLARVEYADWLLSVSRLDIGTSKRRRRRRRRPTARPAARRLRLRWKAFCGKAPRGERPFRSPSKRWEPSKHRKPRESEPRVCVFGDFFISSWRSSPSVLSGRWPVPGAGPCRASHRSRRAPQKKDRPATALPARAHPGRPAPGPTDHRQGPLFAGPQAAGRGPAARCQQQSRPLRPRISPWSAFC